MAELIDRRHFTNLEIMDPHEVCSRTDAGYDQGLSCYLLPLFTSICRVFPKDAIVDWAPGSPQLPGYLQLFAIHYLLSAPRYSPLDRWISEKDMVGGVTFFRGPHAIPTQPITQGLGNSLAAFDALCQRLGGTPLAMADGAYRFTITDRVPVALLYWLGDDEFEAEARLLFDASLADHFALDIIFALAVGVTDTLTQHLTLPPP